MNFTEKSMLDTTYEYTYIDLPGDTLENSVVVMTHLLPILYCLVFSCGLIGNVLVILVLVYYKKMKTTTDVYLLNMAISDLLFVFSLPFLAHQIKNEWIFGNIACKISATIYFIGFFSSIFFITVMSVDRYLAIVRVVFALRVRTVKWGLIISAIVWSLSLFISIPNFIFHKVSKIDSNSARPQCYSEVHEKLWKVFYYSVINIFGLMLPLCILIFSYTHIIKTLKNSKCKKKRCAIRLILIVVIVFLLFWTPYNLVIFLTILQNCGVIDLWDDQLEMASEVTHTLSLVHCCLNPVIYTFAGEKFRMYLQLIIKKLLSCLCGSRVWGSYEGSVTEYTSSTSKISRVSFSSEYVL